VRVVNLHSSFQFSATMRVCVALASTIVANAHVSMRSKVFLASDMQPEVVARTLAEVEDQWKAQAASFAECNATSTDASTECGSEPSSFQKSCATVVSAVVKSSSGERSVVKEYMGDVCGQNSLTGWHQERCNELATAVTDGMSDDNYENRENFNSASLCTSFWTRFAVEEKARVDQERAEREAAEKKAEEERLAAEKKAAEEAAEEQKRREKEEAERKAAEAKAAAEEAAEELAAKKAEAEKQAEEAKHKMEEAKKAAEEAALRHRLAQANATKFSNSSEVQSVNASVPVNTTNATEQATTTTTTTTTATTAAPAKK